MVFFIAENSPMYLETLRGLIGRVFPDSRVSPSQDQVYTNWQKLSEAIQSNTIDSVDLVLVLDLGLQNEDLRDVRSGVAYAYGLRDIRPKSVFIAYTQWVDVAQQQPHFRETFDEVLDKQRLDDFDDRVQQAAYVRQIVLSAAHKRVGLKPAYSRLDSLGMRFAEATFGPSAFEYLVADVASGWQDIQIRALSSGHSGAVLLAFSGTSAEGPQQVVLKCARDPEIIEAELHEGSHLSELGPLAEILAPIDSHLSTLPGKRGCYFRQASIEGVPLLDLMRDPATAGLASSALERVVGIELRCYQRALSSPSPGSVQPSGKFGLSAYDLTRADQSLGFLERAGQMLFKNGGWPDRLPTPEVLTRGLRPLVGNWNATMEKEKPMYAALQHGDLNPSNVLVPSEGHAILIDRARLGFWPIGYDLARLATMCRFRLLNSEGGEDWVLNRIATWLTVGFCLIEEAPTGSASLCPQAAHCDEAIRNILLKQTEQRRSDLVRAYKMGTIWDLVKVMSYVDLSVFKRLWAAAVCWQLASACALV